MTAPAPLAPPTFWQHVRVPMLGEDCCWEWVGTVTSEGYGRWRHRGRPVTASRWLLERLHGGALPAGTETHHRCHDWRTCTGGRSCRHRRCVNPTHLAAVEHRVNVLVGSSPAAANWRRCWRPFPEPAGGSAPPPNPRD